MEEERRMEEERERREEEEREPTKQELALGWLLVVSSFQLFPTAGEYR